MAGKLPGRALDSNTSISVSNISFGSNLSINTSAISIGNSTVNTVLTSNSATFSGHLMPTANITYDLGNSSMRWRDLWLSGTTINLGGAVIQTDTDTGAVAIIPKPTNDTPNPMAVILSAMGGVTAAQSVNGVLGAPAIAAAARSNNAMAVPIDIATSSPSNGQMLVWSTSSNTFIPHSTVAALTVSGNLVVSGNVFFNGATTNVNSTNLVVEDKNIIIGDVATPSDVTADGGGITLKGATDKTITWIDSTDAWTSSEDFNLVSGKSYEINGTVVINSTSLGTGITGSSLTSVGTLTTLAAGNTTITGFANILSNSTVGIQVSRSDASTQYINMRSFSSGHYLIFQSPSTNAKPVVFDVDVNGNTTADTSYLFNIDGVQELKVNSSVTAVNNNLTVVSNTATIGTAAYVVANGNVGIGTATPGYKLDVNGTFNIPADTWITAGGQSLVRLSYFGYSGGYKLATLGVTSSTSTGISLGADVTGNPSGSFTGNEIVIPNNRAVIAPNANNNGYAGVLRVTTDNDIHFGGGYQVNSNYLVISNANGNIGIGTSTPINKLQVVGTIGVSESTTGQRGRLFWTTTGFTGIGLFNDDNSSLVLGTNGTGRVYIDVNGNTGIGVSSPTAKLDVSGTIKDSIGSIRTIQRTGTAKTTSYTLATSDVGQFVEVGTGGSIVVPNDTFATGDVISIFNNTSGSITLTMNITNAYIGGVDADKNSITLLTRGIATILFLSGTLCIVNGNVS
jgi:hypothetical protein